MIVPPRHTRPHTLTLYSGPTTSLYPRRTHTGSLRPSPGAPTRRDPSPRVIHPSAPHGHGRAQPRVHQPLRPRDPPRAARPLQLPQNSPRYGRRGPTRGRQELCLVWRYNSSARREFFPHEGLNKVYL